MRFSVAIAAIAAPVLSAVAQQNILVTVGANDLLAFNPPNITANVGDTVTFQFQSKNHSVTQSTFPDPCSIQTTPAQGIDSGFQLVSANATELPEWSFTINNASAPLWFFCAQTIPANHCHAGMVFSVNANATSAKSFAVYQANAIALGSTTASTIASDAAAATSAIASAVGGAIGDATSAAGAAATAAAGAAAGALTSVAAGAAAALTGTSSASSTSSSTSATPTSGSGRVTSSAVSMLAVFGLAASLLL